MADAPGYHPLYRQVQDLLVTRISNGQWKPGLLLPSEQTLAAELGVSQGTVRKALDAMSADNLLERRQGKGTYVREVTAERSVFQFFRIARPDGGRLTPDSRDAQIGTHTASPEEVERLDLEPGDRVVRILRTRLIEGVPSLVEHICVAHKLFSDLETRPLPNALYSLYQSAYGISITAAEEQLSAVAADPSTAERLEVPAGTPLLQVDRIARDITSRPIEWRRSSCHTQNLVYAVTLR